MNLKEDNSGFIRILFMRHVRSGIAARWVEQWSKTNDFLQMSEAERIVYLVNKELLSYA